MDFVGTKTIGEVLAAMDSGEVIQSLTVLRTDTTNCKSESDLVKVYKNCKVKNVGINRDYKPSLRNPHHDLNGTKNITTSSGEIRTIHKLLIIEFNKHQVLL